MGALDIVTRFEREVRTAVETAQLTGKRLAVAVSGGPDSLAMLYALHRLQDELGLALHVAHLDHGLRGEHSTADADFVVQTCAKLGVNCTVEAADVPAFQREHRMSIEEAAREARYGFLARVAEKVGAAAVVTGHTSDDQIETVLMNFIRGSGLRGLRGMMPTSRRDIGGNDTTLFRPLLNLSKQDTIAYCEALNLAPRSDVSNLSTEMTRNRVRLELLPLMREMNPAFGDAVLRLSRNAEDALTVVDKAVDAAWSDAVAEEGKIIRIDREKFRALDGPVRTHLIIRALSQVKGDAQGIERVHIEDATRAVLDSPDTQLHLPDGLRLSVEQRSAVIYVGDGVFVASSFDASPLTVPGVTNVGEWRITTERIEIPSENHPRDEGGQSPKGFTERFGSAVDVMSLEIRSRLPGDRFQPLGMSGTKKLKDFMIDEKVSKSIRDSIPLIVTSRGIAWVVGRRIAEWAKVGDNDRECLELRVERVE
ncbi:MAG: tRNA lysidine(34) synthetase TilS [Dehalococcoidia bacterium]|nr:tRNA lysidine(34) synthetase TilS [Dehalococcoidia bacterium]